MFTLDGVSLGAAAWLAIGATLGSALALIALHVLSPQFHPSWRMVSEYANGNHRLHGAAFAIGVPALPAAAILLTVAARRDGLDMPVWAAAPPIVSVAAMAVSMAMLFSSLKAAGITPAADSQPLAALPEGISAWNGWAKRLVFAAYDLWGVMAARAVPTKA